MMETQLVVMVAPLLVKLKIYLYAQEDQLRLQILVKSVMVDSLQMQLELHAKLSEEMG